MAVHVEDARELVRAIVDAMIEGRVSRERPYVALDAALLALEAAVSRAVAPAPSLHGESSTGPNRAVRRFLRRGSG